MLGIFCENMLAVLICQHHIQIVGYLFNPILCTHRGWGYFLEPIFIRPFATISPFIILNFFLGSSFAMDQSVFPIADFLDV